MIGETIRHYKILEKLGEGGMGVVYKAEDTKLKRTVALKFLTPLAVGSEEEKSRFVHEAQAAAALDHPNICTVYEIDEAEGKTFIAMAYIEGQSLKEKIESGPLKLVEALDITKQVAEGLQEAQEKGIVHRDIKSANIMVTKKGQAKIMDFGLAKLAGRTKLTKTRTTLGTAAYMSPEQARGEAVDHRSDIWSLGVVLYEMVTGQPPFKGDYEQAVVYSIMNEEPEPITGVRTGVPMELEQIVGKCLEKEPSDRYQHVDELIVDIGRLTKELKSRVISSRRGVSLVTSRKRFQSFRIGVFFLLAAILTLVGYFFFDRILKLEKPQVETISHMKWKNSIAVLPFRDFSPRKDQEYFCYGMTDAINDKLSKITELKVIATTSVMRYKNTEKDIKDIGVELGVANIVEGTLQKEEKRIRIRAQLINAETGFHLWSDTYDQRLKSVFDVQDEISKSIAEALKLKLAPETLGAVSADQPKDMEAYEYYLKGMHFIKSKFVISLQEEDFEAGVAMFEKAIAIDPDYALAYFGLAWAYEHHYHITGDENDSDKMQKNVEKAYQLDPNSAQTNAAKGYYLYEYKGDYDKAFQSHMRALEINSNIGEVNFLAGTCFLYHGLYHQGIKYLSQAIELDPFYFWSPYKLAMCYMNTGEFEKAALYFEKYFELAPRMVLFPGRYTSLCIKMKKYDKAEEILTNAEKIEPDATWIKKYKGILLAAKGEREKALALWKNSEVYSLLEMKDEAIKHINKEIRTRKYPYVRYLYLMNNPFYDNLRDDPRFKKIVMKEQEIYEELLEKYGNL